MMLTLIHIARIPCFASEFIILGAITLHLALYVIMDLSAFEALATQDSFRIAALHLGGADDEIRFSLLPSTFGDGKLEYEAVSYVWGAAEFTDLVYCGERPCRVTPNLLAVLRSLRDQNKDRLLWIDAICINQSNIDERTHQVSRMRDVYSQAKRVVIWMDPSDETLADSAYHLAGLFFAELRKNHQLPSLGSEARTLARNRLVNHPWFVKHSKPTHLFLRNQWFQRVWTFQEAFLAKDAMIFCGRISFPFAPFVASWMFMESLGIKLPLEGAECAKTLFATCAWDLQTKLNGSVETAATELRLSTLLRSTYKYRCTDDRDRVFGLLAMVEGERRLSYSPDYHLSVCDVYITVAKLLIQDDKHLQILSDAKRLTQDPQLPSWVPDWRGVDLMHPLSERARDFKPSYCLHGSFDFPDFLLPCQDPRKLRLHGALVGEIAYLYDVRSMLECIRPRDVRMDNWKEMLSKPRQFFTEIGESAFTLPSIYPQSDEPMLHAFIRTLAADSLPSSSRHTAWDVQDIFPWYSDYSSMTWVQAILPLTIDKSALKTSPYADIVGGPNREVVDFLFGSGELTNWNLSDTDSMVRLKIRTIYRRIAAEIAQSIVTACRHRTIYVTDKGRLGLCSVDAKVGDKVYDLMGGDVPFVLRQTDTENEFKLIADAYLHGVMDGELWQPMADAVGFESVNGDLSWRSVILV